MRFLLTTIILFLLNSCGTSQQDGWQLAYAFYENYADEFIQNEELIKYSYNPRSHFYFNTLNDAPTFRGIIHDTTQLRIIIFENSDRFLEEFGIELDTTTSFGRATVRKVNGELKLLADDNLNIEILKIKTDPLLYFIQLKKLVDKYGIVTYSELRICGIIEVYLSAFDYLLYFPTNYKINEPQFEELWRNKQKQGKQIDQNWYYYKSDEPLDFG